MQLKFIILLSIIYCLLSIPTQATAQRIILPGTSGTPIEIEGPKGSPGSLLDPSEPLTLARIINMSIPILFTIAGLTLFVYFLWGGFKFLTSMGDEQAVAEAKGMLTNAVVGFVVIFSAYWLTVLFGKLFGISIF